MHKRYQAFDVVCQYAIKSSVFLQSWFPSLQVISQPPQLCIQHSYNPLTTPNLPWPPEATWCSWTLNCTYRDSSSTWLMAVGFVNLLLCLIIILSWLVVCNNILLMGYKLVIKSVHQKLKTYIRIELWGGSIINLLLTYPGLKLASHLYPLASPWSHRVCTSTQHVVHIINIKLWPLVSCVCSAY